MDAKRALAVNRACVSKDVCASLLGLPREVRLRIYDHLWSGLRPITVYVVDGECDINTREDREDEPDCRSRFPGNHQPVDRQTTALFYTSKDLSHEALPVFFEKLQVVIDLLGNTSERLGDRSVLDDAAFRQLLRQARSISVEATMFVRRRRTWPCVPKVWHPYMLQDLQILNACLRSDCIRRRLTIFLNDPSALTAKNCLAFARVRWDGEVKLRMHAGTYEQIVGDRELAARLMAVMEATTWYVVIWLSLIHI